jgi:VanZ family protein
VILYLAAISILSHQPALRPPGDLPDWLMHLIEYGGLGVLVARVVVAPPAGLKVSRVVWGAAVCAAFGVLDEFHQSFVPGRTADIRDVAADAAGATLALTAWALVSARWGRRAAPIEIQLFGREGCHLCEEAELLVRQVAARYPVHLKKIDVDGDAELRRRYGDQVPVVTIDGRKLFKFRVDPGRLRRVLDSAQRRRRNP